jgi:glycosyltransferase involved in cell wall biosynthesis
MSPPRPLRVTVVADGDTVHHRRFARAIVDRGQELVTVRWDRLRAAEKVLARLAGEIRASQPDVVLAGPVPTVAADVIAATDAPVVVASWGSDLLVDAARDRTLAIRAATALASAAAVLVDCRTVEDEALRLGARADRIVRFPWGIDLSENRQHPIPPLGDGLKAVSLRSLEPGYRVEVLVTAAAAVDVEVSILGDGSARDELRALAAELGVSDRVRFLGRVDEAGAVLALQRAHLHVSTAPSDGSSISLLQAHAVGRPSLVVDNRSNREWVEHGRTGWLVPVGDPTALAAALEGAKRSFESLPDMARQGRALVEREADWEVHAVTLVETLEGAAMRR